MEPWRVAAAVEEMGLRFVVLTSVDRDDLPDGGAAHFAATIAARAQRSTRCPGVEVLTPDFLGRFDSLRVVVEARPDVFNHNVETVPRLYAQRAARREARPVARPAVGGEDPGPGPDDEVRASCSASARREDEVREPAREAARSGRGHRHDRAVPAPVAREPARRRVRAPGSVRPAPGVRARRSGSGTCSPARSCARRTAPKRPSWPPAPAPESDGPLTGAASALAHAARRHSLGPAVRARLSPGRVGAAPAARARPVAREPRAGREPGPRPVVRRPLRRRATGARRSRGSTTSSRTTEGRARPMGVVCLVILSRILAEWPAIVAWGTVAVAPPGSPWRLAAFPLLWMATEHAALRSSTGASPGT